MRRAAVKARIEETSRKGGDFLDIKEIGVAVVHIHGNRDVGEDAEVEERKVVWIPAEKDEAREEKPGKGGKKKPARGGYKRKFVYQPSDDCAFARFFTALEEDSSIADDTVVLSADGTDYTKDEILGNGDWQKSLRPSTEFLFAVVASSKGEERVKEYKLEVLSAKSTLATAMDGVIDAQVRENGPEEGEASISYYGIELKYDPDAPARSMYKAAYNGRKPPAAALELLEGDGIDLAALCKLKDPEEMRAVLEAALVVEIAGLDLSPGAERQSRGARAGAGKPPARKSATERASDRASGKAADPKPPAKPPAKAPPKKEEPEETEEEENEETEEEENEETDEETEETEEEREEREAAEALAAVQAKKAARLAAKAAEEAAAAEAAKAAAKKPPAKPPAGKAADPKPPAKPPAGGDADGDSTKIQCPKCAKSTVVSASSKNCTHCGHKVIPW